MSFVLIKDEKINITFGNDVDEAVKIAVKNLRADLKASMNIETEDDAEVKIVISTDSSISDKKETYELKVKDGILNITGNDRRGTIYGIYTLSRMLGVSPWYYFADVCIKKKDKLELPENYFERDYPTVEYRGIFINDEEELEKWAKLHMNEDTIGYNTYEKVFELLLRLKANYIWPAMHVNSFNMQPESGALADRMGIVVGTSHCDMLMRSNFREWEPWIAKKGYQDAEYDYSIPGKNREILKEYWRESVEQNSKFEVCYTLGMRGIHDSGFVTKALTYDTEEELKDKKVKLLEEVIEDQVNILKTTLNKDTLMTFVPYKEVLNLYDRGLKVPEELTLIWTNDNYGYIRRYPGKEEQSRVGGNGIYYHNSYWAPSLRHYLFMSSQPLAQTKYELEKAYENGIQKLWVCNMGAIKPLELEMQFFIDLGWDINKENRKTDDVKKYLSMWINENFSGNHGDKTADLLLKFSRVSNTRKVEHLEEDVFSQENYVNEGAIRLNTLKGIFDEANSIYAELKKEERESFFELVLMRIHAAYYSAAMYYFADRSVLCANTNRGSASRKYTELTRGFEDMRRKMLQYYNKEMCNGKWDGIVTPEDFPPPRTAMHPASKPALDIKEDEPDTQRLSNSVAYAIDAKDGKLSDVRIIKYLGRGTKDLLELNDNSKAEYEFKVSKDTAVIIEIHRYPSLNSVGKIALCSSVDDGPLSETEFLSNDEWRGNWAENILNQVDKVTIFEGTLTKGTHILSLCKASKYFAFSKLVVYEGKKLYDNLGIIKANEGDYLGDELPSEEYLSEAKKVWYGEAEIGEKKIPVGGFVCGTNVMDLLDRTDYCGKEEALFMPKGKRSFEELSSVGHELPKEKEDAIIIETLGAYTGSKYATMKGAWDYSTGVTYGRTNMALYFRGRGLSFTEETAPSLEYDFLAEGGSYTIYALMKYSENKASRIHIDIDGEPMKSHWTNERPWRYEGEQPFRYVPLFNCELSQGMHRLKATIYASNLRIEKFVIKKL